MALHPWIGSTKKNKSVEPNDCRLLTKPRHFRYTLPSANRFHVFIFLCRTNPWVKCQRNSILFLNFERILYCYEIKAYFFKNLFLSFFFFVFKIILFVWAKLLGVPRRLRRSWGHAGLPPKLAKCGCGTVGGDEKDMLVCLIVWG